MASRGSKFGIGLVLGTIIGGAAAFFLSPKSGKEDQEMVAKKVKELQKFIEENEIEETARRIFGDVTDKTKKFSTQLQKETKTRVGDMRTAVQNVDVEKYRQQVIKITDELQKEGAAEEMINKATKYLMSFVDKLSGNVKEEKPAKKESAEKKETKSTAKKAN